MRNQNKLWSKCILVVASILTLNSCITAIQKKPPKKASTDVRQELSRVEVDVAANADQKALSRLKQIVINHPETDAADDAYILMGKIYYKNRDYDRAYKAFMSVVNADVYSPNEAQSLLLAAKSLYKVGRFDEALSLTSRSININGIPEEIKLENYELRYKILSEVGDRLDALRALIYLANSSSGQAARDSYRIQALDFVESRLNDEELEDVANDSDFGFVRAYASFRIGQLLFEQRDYWKARDHFSLVVEMIPESDLGEQARSLIAQIDARREVNPKTIGAVLPLSGRYASVAHRTLRGLQMGLGVYGNERSDFRLAVIDSEGNPDVARRAVERLVTEDHVVAVVGSLLSRTSVAVASKADELGVPTIGLSQKSGLTEVGQSVFRNALTSEMQIRHLVKVAMEELGMKRFAILYPNDPYGTEYANLFWDEVLARGGEIRGVQTYDTKETDFRSHIARLVGTYYLEDRLDEYKERLKNYYQKRKSSGGRGHGAPDGLLPPVIDFDAVFVPDSIRAIGQIAPMLAYHDVNNVRLLGTNLWNTSSLIRRGERYVEKAIFVDSLLSSDASFTQSPFYVQYQATFGEAPGVFEAQAYDAGLILRQIIASGEKSRRGVAEKLGELEEFHGSLGSLQMTPSREIDRPIVSLTVSRGQIMRLSDAAKEQDQTSTKKKTR